MRPHRTWSTKAEQVNTNTVTARWVRNRAIPPCLTDLPLQSFIKNQIPHHQHHDCDINSQTSQRVCRSLYLFCATTKENHALFCIHGLGEPTMTVVPLHVWQYPAGSLRWSGQGLWSQRTVKTPTNFRAYGKCAQQSLKRSEWMKSLKSSYDTVGLSCRCKSTKQWNKQLALDF